MQQPVPNMPRHDRDNEVLAAVIAAHNLTQAQLADDTGISAAFLSRVLAGQYAAPPALIRAVWRRTQDHRVLRLALGDEALEQIRAAPTDQRISLALSAATLLGKVADGLTGLAAGRPDAPVLRRDIADSIRALRAIDSHLQTAGKVDLCA